MFKDTCELFELLLRVYAVPFFNQNFQNHVDKELSQPYVRADDDETTGQLCQDAIDFISPTVDSFSSIVKKILWTIIFIFNNSDVRK